MQIVFLALLMALVPGMTVALLPRGPFLWLGGALITGAILAFAFLGVPQRGASDAAGHGMALGYHTALVWAASLGTAAGVLAQLLRYFSPGLTGWYYGLVALGVVLGVLLAAFLLILLRP